MGDGTVIMYMYEYPYRMRWRWRWRGSGRWLGGSHNGVCGRLSGVGLLSLVVVG